MLILTRRLKESICIGDEIVVQVMDVKGRCIRIGIDASSGMAIHRGKARGAERASRMASRAKLAGSA